MKPLLGRIAVHGLLTAGILAFVGLLFAQIGSMWLASASGPRTAPGAPADVADPDGELRDALWTRVPTRMAAMGFLLVAVGELVIYARRRNAPPPDPATPRPDPAEKLLEELLAQAEAQAAAPPAEDKGTGGHGDKEPAPAPLPAAPPEPARAS